jgi:tetratricopeptide (TPR) repeat protein
MKQLLLSALLLVSLPAFAVLPYDFTDEEVGAMPPICQEKIRGGSQRFRESFGMPSWGHMHHYCHGVKFMMRVRKFPQDRSFYLTSARGEFQYVVRAIDKGHWFRPQLYLELAQVHIQLKEHAEAQALLYEAIKLNRTYEPAYAALASMQRQIGVGKMALETATEGLRHVPDSKRLQKAYLENGGKMPFPDPATKTEPAPPAAAESPTVSEPATQAPDEGSADAGANTDADVGAPTENAAAEGSCRFCPPDAIQKRWRESFQAE